MALSAVPMADALQIAAMLRPASFVCHTERMGLIVAIALVVALRTGEQAQPTDPAASPETCGERIELTVGWARRVDGAALIGTEKNTAALVLSEDHQCVPGVVIQKYQAARFADQIDLRGRQPSDDL